MNIFQFLRIFWARRLIVVAGTISCLVGALVVMMIVPARWTGTARVILQTLKPDPITGQVLGKAATVYIATQEALVTDYSVSGRVADLLGWMSDPDLIRNYRARPSSDTRDFRHWIAYNVAQKTTADVVQGTNIMEIKFASNKPDNSRAVSEALRRAYMDVSVSLRRDDANRNADWYTQQSEKARQDLNDAQQKVADYEKANGLAMADEKANLDVDSARLRAISSVGTSPVIEPTPAQASATQIQLAQVDGELAEQTRILGPNHPDVMTLRAKRAALAKLATEEEAKRAAAVAKNRVEQQTQVQRELEAQKTKVAGEKSKLDELTRLQQVVNLLQTQFDKTQAKAVSLRQEAAVADAGVTTLGAATVPPKPDFPNVPLIVAGALVLGAGMGLVVSLIAELLARRVRGAEDLEAIVDAPMLAVISGPANRSRALPRRLRRPAGWPRKAVQG
jgi:uncharacterized protein involved in exopolysaccharide biosynthesis